MKHRHLIIGLSLQLVVFLALLSARASADDASAPADRLTGIYYDMRAGQLPLLPGQPVYIHSEVDKKRLKADVYSVVHCRLADLARTLSRSRNWCRFVTLHLNVKACTWRSTPDPVLRIYAGRKFYQPPEDATRMDCRFRVIAHDQRQLVVLLTAERGELSTRDHRVRLEAERMNDSDVLLHFSLSYRQSLASRMAIRAYLSTLGRSKVGFSRQADGSTGNDYIGGVRGIVERNAMRYFLALVLHGHPGSKRPPGAVPAHPRVVRPHPALRHTTSRSGPHGLPHRQAPRVCKPAETAVRDRHLPLAVKTVGDEK